MSDITIFNGVWTTIDADASNMDKYLSKIGVGFVKRKIGKGLIRTITFDSPDGQNMTITNKSSVSTRTASVSVGHSEVGETEDGRKDVTTSYTFENNGLLITKVDKKGKKETSHWTIEGENMVQSLECDGAKVRLVYKKA